ncbi:MAG: hypothetical protein A3E36_00080 [Candidatus Andersenbacteria bacterium RIFCSPHIGHO2_12_FULL_45_11b]|uniref:Uncharacterized protein n=1 Tax=Candidatus Andersenbacteria bacterium RIFCSPHIGHO2_12_FULL_45_11b TaxID=1797282 RepID=A0A1G1X7T2_9BACT|nr:MAG: hypothetical protein A3E36_00080 [Candidatus Andersenbacteria bacterium RIFCSPHIGHO2_12_FULL_45_11b]
MNVIFAACHVGQARALQPVAAKLVRAGHKVAVFLDETQPAYRSLLAKQIAFPGCEVCIVRSNMIGAIENVEGCLRARNPDRVLVTLSPTDVSDTVEQLLYIAAQLADVPVFGYAEVPCGHLAPAWLRRTPGFTKLFVAQRTHDLQNKLDVVEVGVEVPKMNHENAVRTKDLLGLDHDAPWVWYPGGPYRQAADILTKLVEQVAIFQNKNGKLVSIVFSRHSRDEPGFAAIYREVVLYASSAGVSITENSADHTDTTSVQNPSIVPYVDLLEACSCEGVIVTGHGTDGMVKAPRLGIPSILCVGSELDPHIFREKGCEVLPLPAACPVQITRLGDLGGALHNAVQHRAAYQQLCQTLYPPQECSPADIIVKEMTGKQFA